MGRAYSLSGYLNAVLRRSSPTLLVEGATDKAVLHRLLAEYSRRANRFVIDDSALFDDEALRGLGAKAKILRVQGEVALLSERFPRLSAALAFLVDREWEGLDLDPVSLDETWYPPAQAPLFFTTLGHSIENYHFHPDCFIQYLKFGFAEHFSAELEQQVHLYFGRAVALAGATSLVTRNKQYITRLCGVISFDHVELRENGRFYLSTALLDSLRSRAVADPADFIEEVNSAVDLHWADLAALTHSRWILHGHLGADVLWACISFIALRSGVPADCAEQISRGHQLERRRCWLTWLTTVAPENRFPLDLAVNWLLESSLVAEVGCAADRAGTESG